MILQGSDVQWSGACRCMVILYAISTIGRLRLHLRRTLGLPVHRLIDGGSNLKRTTSWPESQHWSVAPHDFRYLMLALLVVLKLPDNYRITSQAIPTPWGTAICSIREFYFMTQFVTPSGDTSTSVTTKCCTTEYLYSHHIGPTC